MKKADVSEKGLEDIIFEHLTEVEGYVPGTSADYDAASFGQADGLRFHFTGWDN